MKNIHYKLCCFLGLACILTYTSCSKEDVLDMFKRQSDQMSFNYLNETKPLAIASSNHWTVRSQSEWISVNPEEGSGDSQEQNIEVTVAHNKGDQRTGIITVSNGNKSYDVNIVQSAGHIVVERPTVASSFLVDQDITGAQVLIPYTKGAADDFVHVTASLQGPGADGLEIHDVADFQLSAGDGFIPVDLSGVTTTTGEIQIDLLVEIPSRSYTQNFTVKTRVKVDGGIDPLESPTVELIKVLPRLAVLDWGKYIKNSGVSRKFELELATTQYGPAIRRYANQVDWLSSTSIGTGNYFFDHNRFVFGDLEPGTTYWFRVVHKTINTLNLDSDMTYFQFTTPTENIGANVILYKDFDDFWFGGAPIYQAFAVQPTEAQLKTLDPTSSDVKATDYRTHSWNNNIASTFDGNLSPTNAPLLYNAYWDGAKYGSNFTDPNYAGWHGVNAFAATGAVRLAPAAGQGYLKTPKFENITGTADVLITVNTAPYYEPYHSWGEDGLRHYIIIEGDGTIVDGGPTMVSLDNSQQVTVECTSNVDPATNGPLYSTNRTTEHSVRVTGATSNTRLVVSTLPYNASAARVRIWLDDIKVEKL